MNRASDTQGHRYVDAYATRNKTLETSTVDAGWAQRGTTVAALRKTCVCVHHLLVMEVAVIDGAVPIGRTDRRVCACLVSGDVVRTRWHWV